MFANMLKTHLRMTSKYLLLVCPFDIWETVHVRWTATYIIQIHGRIVYVEHIHDAHECTISVYLLCEYPSVYPSNYSHFLKKGTIIVR